MSWNKRDIFFSVLILAPLVLGLVIAFSAPSSSGMAAGFVVFFLLALFLLFIAIYLATHTFSRTATQPDHSGTKIAKALSIFVLGAAFLQLIFTGTWNKIGVLALGIVCALWIRGVDSFIISVKRAENLHNKILSISGLIFLIIAPIVMILIIHYSPNFSN